MHSGKHISQPVTPISGNQGLDLSTYRGWAHSDDELFARASQNVVRHFDSWYLDDKGWGIVERVQPLAQQEVN